MMRPSCYSHSCCGGSQLSRANSLAHAELSSIDNLPVSAIGLGMVAAANLVEVAALVGDTARATMERVADCGIIAPRRTSSALHRPFNALTTAACSGLRPEPDCRPRR